MITINSNGIRDWIAQAGRSKYRTPRLSWWTWLAIGIVIGMLVGSPAHAAPGCMTAHEARQVHPAKHLWWHGEDHCWDAKRGAHAGHHAKQRHVESRHAARAAPKPPPVQSDMPPASFQAQPSTTEAQPPPAQEWFYSDRWWLS